MADKKADLAGPDISTYEEVDKILPHNYETLLGPKERMKTVYKKKNFIEENLCRELNLFMVQSPLIVTKESGVNDYLDRDGSRTFMYLLRTAHLGEVTTAVWPETLKSICKRNNIHVLE